MKFFILMMSLISLQSFASMEVETSLKNEICSRALVKAKSSLMVQECVDKSSFEYACFTDRCFHNMNHGDISFSVYLGDGLVEGEVEVGYDDRINQDTFKLFLLKKAL